MFKKFTFNREQIAIIIFIISSFLLPRSARLMVLVILFILYGCRLTNKMPGIIIYSYFFCIGALVGIFHVNSIDHSTLSYLKHMYFMLFPFLYWQLGADIGRRITSRGRCYQLLTQAILLYSLIDIGRSTYTILMAGASSLSDLRSDIGTGSVLPVIGIYILLLSRIPIRIRQSKKIVFLTIMGLSLVIHFSRAQIISLVILMLCSGIIKNWGRIIEFICGTLIVLAAVCATVPNLMTSFIEKMQDSFTEINFHTTDWDWANINHNWRGYEVYCAIQQFLGESMPEKLFGGGFGTTLDVQGNAFLVTDEDTLVFLHNGYFTQLLVWGVVGVILLVLWLICFLIMANRLPVDEDRRLVRGIVFVIAFDTYIMMGPLFSASVAFLFFVMALIKYSTEYEIEPVSVSLQKRKKYRMAIAR